MALKRYKRELLHRTTAKHREHLYSPHGITRDKATRHAGHATIHGEHFEHTHRQLHELKAHHGNGAHTHHMGTGHHELHVAHQIRDRSAAAHKAAVTRKAKGEKLGFARLTPEQRRANAQKAAQTRRLKHER